MSYMCINTRLTYLIHIDMLEVTRILGLFLQKNHFQKLKVHCRHYTCTLQEKNSFVTLCNRTISYSSIEDNPYKIFITADNLVLQSGLGTLRKYQNNSKLHSQSLVHSFRDFCIESLILFDSFFS